MELGLKGRSALVTAASRGFGRAVSLALAREGVRVAMCARGADDLARAAEDTRRAGSPSVFARPVDVTDGAALTEFVEAAERELGPPDLLLVNAGGPPAGSFFQHDLSTWEAAYRLNVESAIRICRLVLPGMMERGWGRIVQITSMTVRQPVENLTLSNVLRPAVHALTRALALDAAPRAVTVNSVAPGYHTTDRVEQLLAEKMAREGKTRDEAISTWTSQIPLGRLGDPGELAALVVFLMSEPAGYITGQCVVADGGWVRATF